MNVEQGIDFVLSHCTEPLFPRTISTKDTENRQVSVSSKKEILEYFQKANNLDCRISAFSKEDIENCNPHLFFIDLDNKSALEGTLYNIHKFGGKPTIISTGNGIAIIQPLIMSSWKNITQFGINGEELSKLFLQFTERYFSERYCDLGNHPSLKSCMIRVPVTINSKNNHIVEILGMWNKKKISTKNIPFKKYLNDLTKQQSQRYTNTTVNTQNFQWIEQLLLTKIDDSRNFLLFDVTRYLINVKNITDQEAVNIILKWLDSIKYSRSTISSEVKKALKDNKFPRNLTTIQNTNLEIYEYLSSRGIK